MNMLRQTRNAYVILPERTHPVIQTLQKETVGSGPPADQARHGSVVLPAPCGRIPGRLLPRDRMRRKLRTKRGRQCYALWVEPVFGQIKEALGFWQFRLRGLERVNQEWLLICAGHNLLKLFRFGGKASAKARVKQLIGSVENPAVVLGTMVIAKLLGRKHLQPARIVVAGQFRLVYNSD